jgi:hypothetical protein
MHPQPYPTDMIARALTDGRKRVTDLEEQLAVAMKRNSQLAEINASLKEQLLRATTAAPPAPSTRRENGPFPSMRQIAGNGIFYG